MALPVAAVVVASAEGATMRSRSRPETASPDRVETASPDRVETARAGEAVVGATAKIARIEIAVAAIAETRADATSGAVGTSAAVAAGDRRST